MPLEPPRVRALTRNGVNHAGATVWVQSFEVGNLIRLRSMLHVRLVQLLSAGGAPYDFVAAGVCRTSANLVTPAGLREIAGYADVIGPDKNQIDSARAPAPVTLATACVTARPVARAW
jgi:glycerophosphoryl diester phosphodiesterase